MYTANIRRSFINHPFSGAVFLQTVPRNCWAARQPGPSKWGEAKKFPASPSHVEEEQALQTRSPWNHPRTKDKTLTGLTSHPNKAVSFQLEEGLSFVHTLQNSYAKWKMGHAMSCTKKTSHNNESNEMSYIGFPPCQLNDCTCSSLVENSVIHTRSNDPKHLKKARLKKANQMEEIRSGSFPFPASKHLLPTCANTWIEGFNNYANSPAVLHVSYCFMLFSQSWKPCLWIPMQTRQNPLENINWNLGLPWNLLKSIRQQ